MLRELQRALEKRKRGEMGSGPLNDFEKYVEGLFLTIKDDEYEYLDMDATAYSDFPTSTLYISPYQIWSEVRDELAAETAEAAGPYSGWESMWKDLMESEAAESRLTHPSRVASPPAPPFAAAPTAAPTAMPDGLSAYELQRLENIERNNRVLDSLGLLDRPLSRGD